MPMHNADIAAVFAEMANLLEIQGANPFRVRAYRNAARTVQELGWEVRTRLEEPGGLPKLPGIGEELTAKIREIVETGHCAALDRLREEVPPAVAELLQIPGLGPKRVKALYHELDVSTVEQLYRAAREQRIRALPGFGEKTEVHILQAVEAHVTQGKRMKLAVAVQYAEPLAEYLGRSPKATRVVIAGSYRRSRETVGDIDILVVAAPGSPVMQRFAAYDEVAEVLSRGSTRSSVVLKNGLQVDLRVVAEESYGAALHYFTGSKAHNIAIRRLAQELGLPFIPPELREDRGEVEAARAGRLPKLVELEDLRGDLHAHTKATDGHNSLEEMARAARDLGREYLAITEHSRRLTVARGLDPRRLLEQIDEIDALNERLRGVTLLKGIEVDILEDGSLDLPDSVLGRLDLVIGAVHSQFYLSRKQQTERILRAMGHPHFTVLAHPSGRLIQQREPYDVDMLRIFRAAKRRGCYLELNAHPERLDLLDTHCQMAKEEGVLVAINSDAHSTFDLASLRFGIGQARRGWLEKADVLNARTLKELRPLLKRTM
jgi:DNA polymerase (family 10)